MPLVVSANFKSVNILTMADFKLPKLTWKKIPWEYNHPFSQATTSEIQHRAKTQASVFNTQVISMYSQG